MQLDVIILVVFATIWLIASCTIDYIFSDRNKKDLLTVRNDLCKRGIPMSKSPAHFLWMYLHKETDREIASSIIAKKRSR